MQNSILRLLSIFCMTLMVFGVLAGCVNDDVQQPTDGVINDAFFGDPTDGPTDGPTDDPTDGPTDGPTDAPTEAPTEGNTNGDSSIMDGDDYVGVPFG